MPCMELFDKQSEDYKKDLMEENSLVVTLEAGSVTHWQKYTKNKELNIRYRSVWRKCALQRSL